MRVTEKQRLSLFWGREGWPDFYAPIFSLVLSSARSGPSLPQVLICSPFSK